MKKKENDASGLLKRAVEDGRKRNYTAAVKKLKKVLEISDEYTEALLYLGRAYHELKLFQDAVIAFRFFISREPKASAGYFYLGRTYIASGRFNRAASCFAESLRLRDNFAPALAYMGYALMRTGAFTKAVEYLGRAVEKAPDDVRIYSMYINSILLYSLKQFRLENYDSAVNALQFLEEAGYSSITTMLYTGLCLKELKRPGEAVPYISAAVDASPDDILLKNMLAELYVESSRMEEAFKLLETYLDQEGIKSFIEGIEDSEKTLAEAFWNKKNYRAAHHFALISLKKARTADMHLLAGECLKIFGRLDDAFNHFSRAREMAKNTVEPMYGQAVIKWLQEDFKQMLEIISDIEKISPEDEFAKYYRVLCSSRISLPYSQWKDAADNLNVEDDPWLLTAFAGGELSEGNYREAARKYRKAIKINSNNEIGWKGLIEVFEEEKNEKQLSAVLKKYLSIFSEDIIRRRQYSEILMKNGHFSAAAEQFRLLLSSASVDLTSLQKYAYCCRKAGKWSDAVRLYRQILSSDPYNENYLKLLLYCMRKDGRDSETIPLLESAVAAFKRPSPELLLVYGATLYRNGRDEDALNVFQKCIYNGSKDWRIFRNMGIIYKNKGLAEWADMYLKKAEKLKKN
ncbi:MAG: tetratricopeptide repeat protein [Spirochaetales bacterium]|uniref:Tetratricopeptide repeat protein n=1 Tax=Candidatus Thalassospirochaeta sargassi TaxID=3119039 RepID=A0AAJ1IFI5_9SPIO|nr:tetratricopeptide repeat protein [Spirochaetales bacterium]